MKNRHIFLTIFSGIFVATLVASGAIAQDQNPQVWSDATIRSEQLSADSKQRTVYETPAERANDAAIITEVKASIATDGVASGYPITVDAAHGVVTLIGVLRSERDVHHALVLARDCDDVKEVQSKLTVEKQSPTDVREAQAHR